MTKKYKALGRFIKVKRQEKRMSQRQVANRIGFTRSGYANLENGHRKVLPHHMAKIAKVLRISV